MTVHVIFGGCSFTQIYNSYANLIALANTPADNDERRNYLNQKDFYNSQIQWQLFLDKFGNHKHWKEWLERTDFGPLISYDLYTTVKQILPPKSKDYKFYNVAQGGGGNRFNTYCVKEAVTYLRNKYPQDKIKVLFNITSFDRIDTILNKDDTPNYVHYVQSHLGNESNPLASQPSFDDRYWNLDYAWGIGNNKREIKESNQIENRSWVKFGTFEPTITSREIKKGDWNMSNWYKQTAYHFVQEDQIYDNAVHVNNLMNYCRMNNIECQSYFGWNIGLGDISKSSYARDALLELKSHKNYLDFTRLGNNTDPKRFAGFKDWVISQFGYDIVGHGMFDTKGPFELITQDSICNYNKTNPNYFTIKRKCEKNQWLHAGKDNNKLSVEEWNTQFVNNTKASSSVIDPKQYYDTDEIDGHPSIFAHLVFARFLYDMYI